MCNCQALADGLVWLSQLFYVSPLEGNKSLLFVAEWLNY